MEYTIGQAAGRVGLTAHTLRYYDKEGLLPYVGRRSNGVRVFKVSDIGWLELICCLKETGMTIQDIKQIVDLSQQGNETIDERTAILKAHRLVVEKQMQDLERNLCKIDNKIAWYERRKTKCSSCR